MELSLLLAKEILQLFIIVLIGFLLVRCKICKGSDSKLLAILVLYVAVPCSLINAFSVKMETDIIYGLILSFGAAILIQILYIFLGKVLAKAFQFSDVERMTMIYSNAGNLIIPLVGAVLGGQWVIYSSGYMVSQTVLFWTHCKAVISKEKSFSFQSIFCNVGILSVILGMSVFIFQIHLLDMVLNVSSKLGNMLGPLAMLNIGMLFGDMDLKSIFSNKRAYIVVFFRLIAFPMVAILILKLTPLQNIVVNASQILCITSMAACAPAAATVTQFAQVYDNDANYASALNVISVILCIITMPLMIMFYQII